MNTIKSWLLEQFPDYEDHIHSLWGTDKAFEAKSHELFELQERIHNDAEPMDPNQVADLKSRRDALRAELMMLMGANLR